APRVGEARPCARGGAAADAAALAPAAFARSPAQEHLTSVLRTAPAARDRRRDDGRPRRPEAPRLVRRPGPRRRAEDARELRLPVACADGAGARADRMRGPVVGVVGAAVLVSLATLSLGRRRQRLTQAATT